MIGKLIVNSILVGILILFFGLNFDTKIDIHFWFNNKLTLHDVSLFIALFVAFLIGILATLPIYIVGKIKKNKKLKEADTTEEV